MPDAGDTVRPSVRVLSCPNCGGSVTVRAAGRTVSVVCASCGATIDVANDDARIIEGASARSETPLIPIGARATLVGTEWEVVGFQRRRDPDPEDGGSWEEYLLSNPYEGFRFLVASEDEWTLYALLRRDVADPSSVDSRRYQETSRGRAITDYVLGEFYWRVRVGDEAAVIEYAAEPFLLSCEQTVNEVVWSRGVRVPSATITAAFKLAPTAVPPTATDRDATRRTGTKSVMTVFWVTVAILLLAEIVPFGRERNALVFQNRFAIPPAPATAAGFPMADDFLAPPSPATVLTSDAFTVPGVGGSLGIRVSSPVRNSWVQLGLSLVNQGDQRTFDAPVGIAAYNGTDSDGSWSEGSDTGQVVFAGVPGGQYRLLMDVDAQRMHPRPASFASGSVVDATEFTVTVRRHVHSTWNFVLALIAVCAYPGWRWLGDRFLHKGRT